MRLRDQDREQHEGNPGASGTDPAAAGAERDATRERTRQLLDQGDDAIQRALSNDSQSFLAQNQQRGGE